MKILKKLTITVAILTCACEQTVTGIPSETATTKTHAVTPNADQSLLYSSSNDCFTFSSDWEQNVVVHKHFSATFTLKQSCISSDLIKRVRFNADMPAHNHGMNTQPSVKLLKNGFRIDGILYHMIGEWRNQIEITYQKFQTNDTHMEIIEFESEV